MGDSIVGENVSNLHMNMSVSTLEHVRLIQSYLQRQFGNTYVPSRSQVVRYALMRVAIQIEEESTASR